VIRFRQCSGNVVVDHGFDPSRGGRAMRTVRMAKIPETSSFRSRICESSRSRLSVDSVGGHVPECAGRRPRHSVGHSAVWFSIARPPRLG